MATLGRFKLMKQIQYNLRDLNVHAYTPESDKKAVLEEKEKDSDHNTKCYDV